MSVKEFVLKKLEENRGIPLSGEAIANSLSVSRAAVWKAVRALEAEGYHIEAVPNQGYTLCTDNDLLSTQGILPYLTPPSEIPGNPRFPLPSLHESGGKKNGVGECGAGLCRACRRTKRRKGPTGQKLFFSARQWALYECDPAAQGRCFQRRINYHGGSGWCMPGDRHGNWQASANQVGKRPISE